MTSNNNIVSVDDDGRQSAEEYMEKHKIHQLCEVTTNIRSMKTFTV